MIYRSIFNTCKAPFVTRQKGIHDVANEEK